MTSCSARGVHLPAWGVHLHLSPINYPPPNFRSSAKDGGHTIRSVMADGLCARKLHGYLLQNRGVTAYYRLKFYIAGIGLLVTAAISSCKLVLFSDQVFLQLARRSFFLNEAKHRLFRRLTISMTIRRRSWRDLVGREPNTSQPGSCSSLKATARWWFSSTDSSLYISANSDASHHHHHLFVQ